MGVTAADFAVPAGQGRALGMGVDLVYIPDFIEQLRQPGSVFSRARDACAPKNCVGAPRPCDSYASAKTQASCVTSADHQPSAYQSEAPQQGNVNLPAQFIFTDREYRLARARAAATSRPVEYHLAVKYAGKEALIKAWSLALLGEKPPVSDVDFSGIEILSDAWNRPYIQLHSPLDEELTASIGNIVPLLSLSHDGDYALACVVLYAGEGVSA